MPLPKGMSEKEKKIYWGIVHKLTKKGKALREAEEVAYKAIMRKRGKQS